MSALRQHFPFLVLLLLAGCSDSTPPQFNLLNQADLLPGVTTSGQPDAASLQALADAGYVAVIDLRGVDEDRGFDEKTAVEKLGMSYVSLPIDGAGAITYGNASILDETLSSIDGQVLVHCASSNRVGALLTLRELMHGASKDDALRLGTEAGLSSLRATVEERLSER